MTHPVPEIRRTEDRVQLVLDAGTPEQRTVGITPDQALYVSARAQSTARTWEGYDHLKFAVTVELETGGTLVVTAAPAQLWKFGLALVRVARQGPDRVGAA
jgi:hypothetical protein